MIDAQREQRGFFSEEPEERFEPSVRLDLKRMIACCSEVYILYHSPRKANVLASKEKREDEGLVNVRLDLNVDVEVQVNW